jgi:LPXTG-motif cell wall-anchored protein
MKFLILIAIIVTGCLVAGLYGIIHDQFTFTISPEYYTKFKFDQFGLGYEGSDPLRLRVCIVGFFATWWMGIPIATILGLVGFQSNKGVMFTTAIRAFVVTMGIAFATGLLGLCWGFIYLANQPRQNFQHWFIPDNLVDYRSFIAVGSMHNASYLGGVLGLAGGIVYVRRRKRKSKCIQMREILFKKDNA